MTSIVELFPKSRKLAYDSRQQLSQIQNGTVHPSELFLSIEELTRQLSIMDALLLRETPAQREMWRRKIYDLQQDAESIRRQGEYYSRVTSAGLRQQRESEELMALRRRRRGGNNDDNNAHAATMNDLSEESDSWGQSHSMMGDLLASGQASLSGLVEQRQRLKGVKRVLLDIGNKIGVSNSLMRVVERRDVTDAYFVFGGILVTLIIMYLCWLR